MHLNYIHQNPVKHSLTKQMSAITFEFVVAKFISRSYFKIWLFCIESRPASCQPIRLKNLPSRRKYK